MEELLSGIALVGSARAACRTLPHRWQVFARFGNWAERCPGGWSRTVQSYGPRWSWRNAGPRR
jgi:hypothetical protein